MTTIEIADRLTRIEQSASSLASQKARAMRAEGRDVIALSSGEPDFATPDHVIDAAFEAARKGQTRYTNAAGTPELKQAIIEKFKNENGLEYSEDEVMASTGGKQVIFNSLVATVEEGDEVIIPAPYWISYVDITKFAGGVPVVVPCPVENDFKMTPEILEASITPKTKWLILNSPSNPCGAVYSADDLRGLADVLLKFPDIMIFSDDITNTSFMTASNLRPLRRSNLN
jgi:aspartate aminotransferase